MVNTQLFKSLITRSVPRTNVVNEAGGAAYALSSEEALAQYALTGTLYNTFYASAEDQAETALLLAYDVEPEFLMKLAILRKSLGCCKKRSRKIHFSISVQTFVILDSCSKARGSTLWASSVLMYFADKFSSMEEI